MNKSSREKMFLHVDGDSFFVACELTARPDLKGRPVVTGSERGIVSALSREAKLSGITRAMPVFKAKKLCKELVVLDSNFKLYQKYSRRMVEIVKRFTKKVEAYSIDECFLDITELDKVFGLSYESVARKLQQDLEEDLGITFSVGVSITKTLAKIASGYKKPSGCTIVTADTVDRFLKNIPVEDVWGIGRKGAVKARGLGIKTAYDFSQYPMDGLQKFFSKPALVLQEELKGKSCCGVHHIRSEYPLSIRSTRSFIATRDSVKIFSWVIYHLERVCKTLRLQGLVARRVNILLRTKTLQYYSKEIIFPEGFNTVFESASRVRGAFESIFSDKFFYKTAGIVVGDLVPQASQISLNIFNEVNLNDKRKKIMRCVDELNEKFHTSQIRMATNQINQKNLRDVEFLELPFLGYVY